MASDDRASDLGWDNRIEAVLVDCLIRRMLQGLTTPTDPWDEIGTIDGGHASRIRLISIAGSMYKEWHILVSSLVEHATLRLAKSDLVSVPATGSLIMMPS